MPLPSHPKEPHEPAREPKALGSALGSLWLVLVATCPLALFWGFSVDDAWIVRRVVEVGKVTGIFTLNPGPTRVDAVTPLGFAELVGLVSNWTGLESFDAARTLGAVGWLAAWGLVGSRLGQTARSLWSWTLASVGAMVGLTGGAWASSGLETGLVTFCLTWGMISPKGRWFESFGAGMAAAWRPELLIVGSVDLFFKDQRVRRAIAFLGPSLVIVALRAQLFGSALPLSALAKPSDPETGLLYTWNAFVLSAVPWLLLPALRERNRRAGVIVTTVLAHSLALTLAGGDWMPLFRLLVPLLPWMGFMAANVQASRTLAIVSIVLSLSNAGWLFYHFHSDATRVVETRRGWIERGRPLLDGARKIAAVDLGWVGAASSAPLVDLSGVANRDVARLPGGHTSHRVPSAYLDAQAVDTWILRVKGTPETTSPIEDLRAVYAVDHRLLRDARVLGFQIVGTVPIERTGSAYVVLRRAPFDLPLPTNSLRQPY